MTDITYIRTYEGWLFYNAVTRHGHNDDLSPKAFENNYFKKLGSA